MEQHDNRVFKEEPAAQRSLLSLINEHACSHPDKLMAISPSDSITYRQGYNLAISLTRYLLFNLGMTRGDVVVTYVANHIALPSIIAAFQAVGLRVVMRAPSILLSRIEQDAKELHPSLFLLESQEAYQLVRQIGLTQSTINLSEGSDAGVTLTDILAIAIQKEPVSFVLDPDTAETVLFTSGSSGNPKGVISKMASFSHNAYFLTKELGITSVDVLYAPVPAFHVYGLVSMFTALCRQATWAIISKYAVKDSLDFMEKARASIAFCVPTTTIRELKENIVHPRNLSALRLCMVAGDCCPEDVLIRYEKQIGCKVVLSYGMTETSATLTVENPSAPQDVRIRSNGHAIEGVTIEVDPNSSELLVKSSSLMTSYLIGEQETKPELDENGWFHTGDTGYLDNAGRVYVTGRSKNIIVRGGINVYPAQVEAVYRVHPDVDSCAAIGYPDKELGQRICLVYVPCSTTLPSDNDLRSFAFTKIEKGALPDKFIAISEIPTLANNKRDNAALCKLAAEGRID